MMLPLRHLAAALLLMLGTVALTLVAFLVRARSD